jgi:alpha-tubulin suppressor-like RCC1 family protein
LGSVWNENVQGILLTTTGLHVWGRPGVVVATSLTTNWRMQPITVGGNTNGLPTGVTPAMVKMMFVTGRTIAITTCDGDAYVLSQNATLNQGGSSTAWTRVQDSSNNNLTGVVALRGSAGVMFALKSDNTLWTWGINTYLGDGSAFVATRNRAEQMTAPITGINIKMIGATFSGIEPAGYPTYYVLATDGNLYSMGRNNQKQIGDWAGTSTHRTSWVQPRYTSASGQVMNNIKWISPAEHDWELGAINVITNNADLYNWGSNTNNRYMLGRGTTEM